MISVRNKPLVGYTSLLNIKGKSLKLILSLFTKGKYTFAFKIYRSNYFNSNTLGERLDLKGAYASFV